jgi:hypothetical protein
VDNGTQYYQADDSIVFLGDFVDKEIIAGNP